jgi:hypothetical protein
VGKAEKKETRLSGDSNAYLVVKFQPTAHRSLPNLFRR